MANNPIIKKYLKFADARAINGKEYNDERINYIGRSGLFMSIISTSKPGKIKGIFYVIDDNGHVASIRTSSGEIKENEEFLFLRTTNSMYSFSKNYSLTDDEEKQLFEHVNKKSNQPERPSEKEANAMPKAEPKEKQPEIKQEAPKEEKKGVPKKQEMPQKEAMPPAKEEKVVEKPKPIQSSQSQVEEIIEEEEENGNIMDEINDFDEDEFDGNDMEEEFYDEGYSENDYGEDEDVPIIKSEEVIQQPDNSTPKEMPKAKNTLKDEDVNDFEDLMSFLDDDDDDDF